MIREYIKLIRVKHYIKNLLILLPLFFSKQLTNTVVLKNALIGFLSFSLLSSVVYIMNDIQDIEKDKNHEVKKNRPLASGKIKAPMAVTLLIIFFFTSLTLNFLLNSSIYSWIILVVYLIINIAYSYGLKAIPIIDISIIAAGFILRMMFGGIICSIEISHWMYLTILSVSFYLALGKRRNEIIKIGDSTRDVLKRYNISFLDKFMYVCVALSIAFYALWTVSQGSSSRYNYVIWTVPLVIVILMKYSLIIEGNNYGDPADIIWNDKVLIVLILFYISVLSLVTYFV